MSTKRDKFARNAPCRAVQSNRVATSTFLLKSCFSVLDDVVDRTCPSIVMLLFKVKFFVDQRSLSQITLRYAQIPLPVLRVHEDKS